MKAIILVGGEGTRLRPLTYTLAKPLLPVANQPHLERQIEWLARFGVTEAVLSMGYQPDAFREHFSDGTHAGVRISYAIEDEPLGTGGAIRFAAGGIDERVVVCNGDVLTDLDLDEMCEFHRARNALATISLAQVDDPSAFGVVPTNSDGSVQAFVEKPSRNEAPSDWINAGTYVLEPEVISRIPETIPTSVERVVFPEMISEQLALFAFSYDGYWLDIGTPEQYLRANLDVLAGKVHGQSVAGDGNAGLWIQAQSVEQGAELVAPVLVGEGSTVATNARLDNVAIGRNCVIEQGVTIRDSVVLDGARIARSATVSESIVGWNAQVGQKAAVQDQSVLGAGSVIEADGVVSRVRLNPELR